MINVNNEQVLTHEQTLFPKNLLKNIAGKIPHNLSGIDRQIFIADMIEKTSPEERLILRKLFEKFLLMMRENDASDIDLGGNGCDGKIWYRIQGEKKPEEKFGTFTLFETDVLCQSLLSSKQRNYLFKNKNLDFSFQIYDNEKNERFRADLYFDLDHLCLNMRYIQNTILPVSDLGFHPNILKAMSLKFVKQGLILITGITGSGKSSTLDSILDINNSTVNAHITIIGSPIETVHTSKKCIVRHREVGNDVLSFKEGAIQSLRQDPDVIVVGEMRDPDTIMTVLEITDSGHKVFSTLHTASAVESLDRIIAECPSVEQERIRNRLADVLTCVVSQKLVPGTGGKRILAKEVLLSTPSVKAAIKNNNTGEIYQMITESNRLGMITMEQDLHRLYLKKQITKEEAVNYANNKNRILELLKGI